MCMYVCLCVRMVVGGFIRAAARINPRSLYMVYRVILGHRNWQIETAVWNLAGFFTVGLEPRWQRSGQFLDDL